jgi:hypothetical protein
VVVISGIRKGTITMSLHKNDVSEWYDSLDDTKPEHTPIKCWSTLQFYTVKQKAKTISKANIEVIRYLYYTVYSPAEKRYYRKFFRAYPLDVLYFYRKSEAFSGEDQAVLNLQRYVEDRNVTLLFTKQQVDDTTAMLERLWNFHFAEPGKLQYRDYVELLRLSLDYEDYIDTGRSLVGFKTVCKSYEDKINAVWNKAWEGRQK